MGVINNLISPSVLQGNYGNLVTALFRPARSIDAFSSQVTLSEVGEDDLEITDHPIATGAAVTDHSYKKPAVVRIQVGFSNSSLASLITDIAGALQFITSGTVGSLNYAAMVYGQFQTLQNLRQPFTIVTGKRTYKNMLIKNMVQHTDKETENMLALTVNCREINLVNVTTTQSTNTDGNLPTPENPTVTNPVSMIGTLSPIATALTPGSAFNALQAAQQLPGNLINLSTGGLGT